MGTFGGALEARQIDASNAKLTADVTGEVETEEGVLVIRRIHVAMRLIIAPKTSKQRWNGFTVSTPCAVLCIERFTRPSSSPHPSNLSRQGPNLEGPMIENLGRHSFATLPGVL
jgi:hypothetical protein